MPDSSNAPNPVLNNGLSCQHRSAFKLGLLQGTTERSNEGTTRQDEDEDEDEGIDMPAKHTIIDSTIMKHRAITYASILQDMAPTPPGGSYETAAIVLKTWTTESILSSTFFSRQIACAIRTPTYSCASQRDIRIPISTNQFIPECLTSVAHAYEVRL